MVESATTPSGSARNARTRSSSGSIAAATRALATTGLPSYSGAAPAGATAHSPLGGSTRAHTFCGAWMRTPVDAAPRRVERKIHAAELHAEVRYGNDRHVRDDVRDHAVRVAGDDGLQRARRQLADEPENLAAVVARGEVARVRGLAAPSAGVRREHDELSASLA